MICSLYRGAALPLMYDLKAEFADEYQVLRWRRGLQRAQWNGRRPILSSENPQIYTFALDEEMVDERSNLRCRAMLTHV